MRIKAITAWRTKDGTRRNVPLFRVWKNINARERGARSWNGSQSPAMGQGVGWRDWPHFREWALANGYRKGLVIDRINEEGGYSPSNCQFISHRANLIKYHRYKKGEP